MRALSSGALLTTAALLLLPGAARAEASSAQRAAAEALFQQATQLMDGQQYAEACEKFAASQELDPALGTLLYLADCYERAGRTASAWALFRQAAELSKRAGQADRERIAAERAVSLDARLSRLELRVPASHRVTGFELRLNDVPVPAASWNAPLPVDPGLTRIEARAPGKKSWSRRISIEQGPSTQNLDIPRLADAPVPLAKRSAVPPAEARIGSAQRTFGYVLGASGLVALAAGGFFGYRAYSLNKQSKGECRSEDPNACTPNGVDMREDAKTAGALSTITAAAGGVLVVSGVTLVATAPSRITERAEVARTASLWSGLSLQVRGAW